MAIWARDDVRQAFADQLGDRARARDAGDEAIGWKIGLASEAAKANAGVEAPLIGYLLASGRNETTATISVTERVNPVLEPEIAVYLGADVPAGASPEEASAAITSISLAFEIVDLDHPLTDAPAVLRRNVFQRGVVFGERVPASVAPPAVTVLVDGAVLAEIADPVAVTGEYAPLVQHIADVLGANGETLRAGEAIITGMVTPPIALSPGRYAMRGAGLGEIELIVTG